MRRRVSAVVIAALMATMMVAGSAGAAFAAGGSGITITPEAQSGNVQNEQD